MSHISELQEKVGLFFKSVFGRTSLRSRLDDILKEAVELQRYTDLENLNEEAGDLACTLLAFFHESGLSFDDAVNRTLTKIERRKEQYKSLGRKAKIALLGGAFDPPTLGHIAVAKLVLDTSREFDEVWLVPCYRHMFNKKMTNAEDRLAMLELATHEDGRIRVFDYEIQHKLGGETYHFLKSLLDSEYAQTHEFSYIIGMDNANHFDRWVNFEELERLIRFVVVPRSGEEAKSGVDWYLKPPHIFLRSDAPLPETASSIVREEVRKVVTTDSEYVTDQQIRDALLTMVHPNVADYLLRRKLYARNAEDLL